jgi:hypothetical protein
MAMPSLVGIHGATEWRLSQIGVEGALAVSVAAGLASHFEPDEF